MIFNTSSTNGSTPLPPNYSRPNQAPAPQPAGTPSEQLSTIHAENLRAALARTPEIRPEVVERARGLSADPLYPPRQIIEDVARLITASEDPSEQED